VAEDLFSAAMRDLFADPNLAVMATYRPATGPDIAVRVILERGDAIVGLGQAGLRAPDLVAQLQAAEVANPRDGDALVLADGTYRVRTPRADPTRTVWMVDLQQA
jgi:hypothetical protein